MEEVIKFGAGLKNVTSPGVEERRERREERGEEKTEVRVNLNLPLKGVRFSNGELGEEIIVEKDYDAGFKAGYEHRAEEQRGRGAEGQFLELIKGIMEERERIIKSSESTILTLVSEIAKKVIEKELSVDPEIIVGVIRAALKEAIDKDKIIIRISPEDSRVVKQMRDERGERTSSLGRDESASGGLEDEKVEIMEDERVSRGGCLIEYDSGTIDATIETKLKKMDEVLGVE